jgi:predicted flap endonuclease-1-like 5' DNA nuclease
MPAFMSPQKFASQVERTGSSWFIWMLVLVAFLFLFWWFIKRIVNTKQDQEQSSNIMPVKETDTSMVKPKKIVSAGSIHPSYDLKQPELVQVAAFEPAVPSVSEEDDLKIIEGIGPKISSLLKSSGIHTFAKLAETDVDTLRKLLLGANWRVADPTTWPEQAGLAAKKDWDALKALQTNLKGGRRV